MSDYKSNRDRLFGKDATEQKRQKIQPIEGRMGRPAVYPDRKPEDIKRITAKVEIEVFMAVKTALGTTHLDLTQNEIVNEALKMYLGEETIKSAKRIHAKNKKPSP